MSAVILEKQVAGLAAAKTDHEDPYRRAWFIRSFLLAAMRRDKISRLSIGDETREMLQEVFVDKGCHLRIFSGSSAKAVVISRCAHLPEQ